MKGYKQVAICDCALGLSCSSAWPWQKLMYKQVTINTPSYLPEVFTLAYARIIRHVYHQGHSYVEVMSAVPYMSGFLFRFAVFSSSVLCSDYKAAQFLGSS
jgi:hypothetical protein